MTSTAWTFWQLVVNTPEVDDTVDGCRRLWESDVDEAAFASAAVSFIVAVCTSEVGGPRFAAHQPSPEVCRQYDQDVQRSLEAARATWEIITKAGYSYATGVVDPFVDDERVATFRKYGALAVLWLQHWAWEMLMWVAEQEDPGVDWETYIRRIEHQVRELPTP